jgi:hypothetical protein
MTNKEMERYKQKVGTILNQKGDDYESLTKKQVDLQFIVEKVGAAKHLGTSALSNLGKLLNSRCADPMEKCDVMKAIITESVYNIYDALRTEIMINCSKTASRSLIASVIVAMIALVSAAAAWFAVIRN